MIWIDLDGVLADFDGEYQRVFGVNPRGLNKQAKWDNMATCPEFFLTIPWMPGAKALWDLIKPHGAHILTAYAYSVPNCCHHKIQWCMRELEIGTDRIVAVSGKHNKTAFCQQGDLLIDDREENVQAWWEAGGYGYLYTNPEGAIKAVKYYLNTI